MGKNNFSDIEEQIEKKGAKKNQRRKKMKISGRQLFRLKKLMEKQK